MRPLAGLGEAAGRLREAAELLVLTASLCRYGRITVPEKLDLKFEALQLLRKAPREEREASLSFEVSLLKELWLAPPGKVHKAAAAHEGVIKDALEQQKEEQRARTQARLLARKESTRSKT